LTERVDVSSVDSPVPRHHAVTGKLLVLALHSEFLAPVRLEGVQFLEGSLVKEELQTLPGRQGSLLVLLVDAGLATAQQRSCPLLRKAGLEFGLEDRRIVFVEVVVVVVVLAVVVAVAVPWSAGTETPRSLGCRREWFSS